MNTKKHSGEMSFYAIIISVCLIVLFSPLFFYIQSRQQISTTKEEIEVSLKSYSKMIFNELYDDTKELNTNGDMYKAISNSDKLKTKIPVKILTELSFSQTTEEKEKNEFSRNNTKISTPSLILEKKSNNEYLFKMSYGITQKMFSFDSSVLTFSNNYVAECRVYRDSKYMDTAQVPETTEINGNKAFSPDDVIEDWDVSEKTDEMRLPSSVHAYYCKGGKFYVTGTGFVANRSSFKKMELPWDKYKDEIKEVYFLDNVYNVSDSMFYDFNNIEKVEFNKTMYYIESSAFFGTNINTVFIPGCVKEIGSNCFNKVTTINTDTSAIVLKNTIINSLKVYRHSDPFSSQKVTIKGINGTCEKDVEF